MCSADPSLAPGVRFRTERVVPHPRETIFDAFARADLLSQWWGPEGFTNTFEVFEFKPGGRWKFVMHGPQGSTHPNESVFVRLEASALVVIQHVSEPHFVLTVTLHPDPAGSRIEWDQRFEDAVFAARVRSIVEPANEQNLDRLQAVLSHANAV